MNAAIAADRDHYQWVNNYHQDDSMGGKSTNGASAVTSSTIVWICLSVCLSFPEGSIQQRKQMFVTIGSCSSHYNPGLPWERGGVGVFLIQKDKNCVANEDRIRLNHKIKWNENTESYVFINHKWLNIGSFIYFKLYFTGLIPNQLGPSSIPGSGLWSMLIPDSINTS